MKITIDRRKWRTGDRGKYATGIGETLLENPQGYMCCLGFTCSQAVPHQGKTLGLFTPANFGDVPLLTEPGLHKRRVNSPVAYSAMGLNDDEETTPAKKEAALLELFKDTIYELEFVGEYK